MDEITYRAGQPPQVPRQRPRRPLWPVVLVSVLAGAVILVVVVLAVIIVRRPGAATAPIAQQGTVAPSSASQPTYDKNAVEACKDAASASQESNRFMATRTAAIARAEALFSHVSELRKIARSNASPGDTSLNINATRAMTAARQINAWCLAHQAAAS